MIDTLLDFLIFSSLLNFLFLLNGNVTSSIRNIPPTELNRTTNLPTYCNIGPYASCLFLYYLRVRLG